MRINGLTGLPAVAALGLLQLWPVCMAIHAYYLSQQIEWLYSGLLHVEGAPVPTVSALYFATGRFWWVAPVLTSIAAVAVLSPRHRNGNGPTIVFAVTIALSMLMSFTAAQAVIQPWAAFVTEISKRGLM